MQIAFSYPSGRRMFAAVLGVGTDSIRVVAPRRVDGFDLYLRDEAWVTETGRPIRIDAILFGDETRLPSAVSRKRGKSTRKTVKVAVAGASGT